MKFVEQFIHCFWVSDKRCNDKINKFWQKQQNNWKRLGDFSGKALWGWNSCHPNDGNGKNKEVML